MENHQCYPSSYATYSILSLFSFQSGVLSRSPDEGWRAMALGDETWRAGGRGEGPWQLPGEDQPLELVMRRNSLGESISLIKYVGSQPQLYI